MQNIDGAAEIVPDNRFILLKPSEGIIIQIRSKHCSRAKEQFQMIITVVKST
jgi:hypothetical protein